MSDWDVYGRVGGAGDISTDSRKRKRSGKSDRNGGTGKKHLLKKVQINKQEKKNTNNVGACVTGWRIRNGQSVGKHSPSANISITIHPEAFGTFLIAHNHRLANTRAVCE